MPTAALRVLRWLAASLIWYTIYSSLPLYLARLKAVEHGVMPVPTTIIFVSGDRGSRRMSAILGPRIALAFAGGTGVSIVRIGSDGGNESLVHLRLVYSI
jgi:hypothetical protein